MLSPPSRDRIISDSSKAVGALGLTGEGRTVAFPIVIPDVSASDFAYLLDWIYIPQYVPFLSFISFLSFGPLT